MKQIILNILYKKFNIFFDFIQKLDYVEVESVREHDLAELQESLHQVKLIREGRLPKQTVQDFMNEL